MPRPSCNICKADNRDDIEALGVAALAKKMSWTAAAKEGGVPAYKSLQNHMEKHFTSEVAGSQEETDEFQLLVNETYEAIVAEAKLTPDPHRRSELLEEAHNLKGLPHTKPSQEHLQRIRKERREAAKTATQMELMVAFGAQAFRQVPQPVEVLTLELPPGGED